MPIVTVQLGQCGNQMGGSLFQALSTELQSAEYTSSHRDMFFRPILPGQNRGSRVQFAARAVMIDMEPKVIEATRHAATRQGSWWRYSMNSTFSQQSGAGNNWALGYHGYGPRVRDAALDVVRHEVEAADCLHGFLLLQSMAGGTGAGFGTYMTQALRDEYPGSFLLNSCIWPYDSGEVMVQSYNTLLSMSHLAQLSDGVVVTHNDWLHAICSRLHGLPRPSFADMNAVAAQGLACMLLPSTRRSVAGGGRTGSERGQHSPAAVPTMRSNSYRGASSPAAESPGTSLAATIKNLTGLKVADSCLPAGSPAASRPSASSAGVPFQPLGDLVAATCSHPWYRLLTLRAVPQMPPQHVDFTTFTWSAIMKRLRQMQITGSCMEEGLDWGVAPSPASPAAHSMHSTQGTRSTNKAVAALLALRGQNAMEIDASDLADPALYTYWSAEPLTVTASPAKLNRYAMAAAMLVNDQTAIGPMRSMQERAYSMLSARAFVHQYEKYGMEAADIENALVQIEEIVARYQQL